MPIGHRRVGRSGIARSVSAVRRFATVLGALATTAVLLYLGLCTLLFFNQRSQIYFPTPRHAERPTLTVERDGVLLRVAQQARDSASAVLYFGGNAEDVSYSVPELAERFPEAAIYALHYRSYGGSEGQPSEAALIGDGLAVFDRIAAAHPRVTVIGRSLGSGIAVPVAAQRPVERLVLVTPFDSLVNVAAAHFPAFPVRWLLRDRYASDRHAAGVRAPVTLIIAGNDRIVPAARGLQLAEAFGANTPDVVVIERAGHNDVDRYPAYHAALRGRDDARRSPQP